MEEKKMKKLLVLVLAACLSIGLLGGLTVASADEVYELNVSFAAPEFSTLGITAALDRIQEASEGRIKFNYYYSWSLSSVPTVIDDLASGVCDIAEVPINEHLNTFTYSNLITYTPFLPMKGMRDAALTFNELFNEWECLQNEYTSLGIHYWTNIPCPVYNIFTTADKAIKVPGDMAGLKLITSSKLLSDFVAANGGAVVNSPVTDYATNLNTNVVDGVINHIKVITAFGCLDFLDGVTTFGESGMAMNLMMMCISQSCWDRLPEDLQQLFNDEIDRLLNEQCDQDIEMSTNNMKVLEDRGVPITALNEEEIAVWRDAFDDMRQGYIDELESTGYDQAQELYDALMEKLAD